MEGGEGGGRRARDHILYTSIYAYIHIYIYIYIYKLWYCWPLNRSQVPCWSPKGLGRSSQAPLGGKSSRVSGFPVRLKTLIGKVLYVRISSAAICSEANVGMSGMLLFLRSTQSSPDLALLGLTRFPSKP